MPRLVLPHSITNALINFENAVRASERNGNPHPLEMTADKSCSKLFDAIRKELEDRDRTIEAFQQQID